jgi:sugar/nucleoside kinase (ribokinase family)
LCLGELLVDFCQTGTNGSGYPVYEANPGGAPANVAVALARWGLRSGFIGKVGRDALGRFLAATLEETGVDCGHLLFSDRPTTMAMVSTGDGGERSFDFLRNGAADTDLQPAELEPQWVGATRIFHFGSVSLTTDPVRSATLAAVDQARAGGALISFDPNLRPALWASLAEAREWMLRGAQGADVIKVSEEELTFLLGGEDLPLEPAARRFHRETGAQLLFVTLGANGCLWVNAQGSGAVPAPRVNPVDTTGAGDAFVAGVIYRLIRSGQPLATLKPENLEAMVRFANAAGALTTEKRGAIPALPHLDAITALLE